jgi:hypothetical protein
VARLALVEAVVDAVNVASAAVSGGNLRIFGDMAPVFARFLRAFGQDQRYDPARLEAFLAELAPGPSAEGGQDTLASALRRFYEAAFEPDERRRAELILLGNLEVGLHEQIRVQSDIDEALGAPLRRHLGDELGRLLADGRLGPIPAGLRRRLVRRADALEARLDHALARVVRRLLTRHQMALRLPGGAVRLGRDLRGTGRAEAVPGVLRSPEHPELVALLARFDRSAARGTRALDWGSLEDRMNFIAHLFRTRQRDLNLLSAPFTPAQVLEIDAGRVPAGPL